jgi:hypothetical protein
VRRRGQNIFEVSDEIWGQADTALRDAEDNVQADLFSRVDAQASAVAEAGARQLGAHPAVGLGGSGPAILWPRRVLVAGGVLVAAGIAIGALVQTGRGGNHFLSGAAPTQAVDKSPGGVGRRATGGASRHPPFSRRSRSQGATPGRTPVKRARKRSHHVLRSGTTRPATPAKSRGVGEEFGFER